VNSGDDRMLTGFAALEGRTVFQETSVGYTLLPSNMGHLTRQRGRWWRSFWWGGLWLIRRFKPTRAIWWLVASQYVTFVLYAVMFPLILIYDPITHHKFPFAFFLYVIGLSYLRSARTLAVNRPDQTLRSQLLNFVFIPPLVTLLNLWLCTVLQWWGMFTFYETGWRTRQGQGAEVGINHAKRTTRPGFLQRVTGLAYLKSARTRATNSVVDDKATTHQQ
jgi:hyaluronan synthase